MFEIVGNGFLKKKRIFMEWYNPILEVNNHLVIYICSSFVILDMINKIRMCYLKVANVTIKYQRRSGLIIPLPSSLENERHKLMYLYEDYTSGYKLFFSEHCFFSLKPLK